MDKEQIKQHVRILGLLHLLSGGLFAVIGGFVFVFLSGIGAVVEDPFVFRVLTVVGFTTGTFLVVLGVPGMAAGYGLLTQRSWGRVLAIAAGILNLINIPIGTAIGIYTLAVLLKTDDEGQVTALKPA